MGEWDTLYLQFLPCIVRKPAVSDFDRDRRKSRECVIKILDGEPLLSPMEKSDKVCIRDLFEQTIKTPNN
jgi:hypothetical protein